MKRIILETPYAGDTEKYLIYARECMRDCLYRGEAPMASHLLYTQCLDDTIKNERMLGINAGFVWRKSADYTVVYIDHGISRGMQLGIDHAKKINHEVKYRRLL
jgi:hypothetical protein